MRGRAMRLLTAAALGAALSGAALPEAARAADNGSPTLSATPPRPTTPASVPTHMATDRVLGRLDAPITIIEYASFTCSHCASFSTQVLPELKRRYIDTGKAKLVFRDLPTPPVQVSNVAAAIARCAAPDKFFDVADHFMNGQSEAFSSGQLNAWIMGGVAASGRSREQIEACVRLPATAAALNQDTHSALESGVNATPALFVNGKRVQDHSLEGMIAAIQPLVH